MGESFRFIHCSDLHLGCNFKGVSFNDPELGNNLRKSVFDALEKIVSVAKKESVDFVVFSGDIFDGENETPSTRSKFAKALEAIKVPCYIIYGNHDSKRKWEESIPLPKNAVVFSESVSHEIFKKNGIDTAEIIGASFSPSNPKMDVTADVKKDTKLFGIGLFHCNVNGSAEHDDYAPCKLSSLISKDVDYWALGHIHKREILNEKPCVVYSGNTQGMDHKESGEKGALIVTVNNGEVSEMAFFKTGSIIWKDETIDITGCNKIEDVINRITAGKDSIVTLTFTGRGILDEILRIERKDVKRMIEETKGCIVSEMILKTTPDFDLDAREDVGDFISAVLSYRKKLKEARREEILDIICSSQTSKSLRDRFDMFSDEELQQMLDDSAYLVIEKLSGGAR